MFSVIIYSNLNFMLKMYFKVVKNSTKIKTSIPEGRQFFKLHCVIYLSLIGRIFHLLSLFKNEINNEDNYEDTGFLPGRWLTIGEICFHVR